MGGGMDGGMGGGMGGGGAMDDIDFGNIYLLTFYIMTKTDLKKIL